MLGAHGFALTASYHPSLGNDTKYDCGLKKFTLSKKLGETILRKKYASTFKEPRGSPTSNGGTSRRPRVKFTRTVSLVWDPRKTQQRGHETRPTRRMKMWSEFGRDQFQTTISQRVFNQFRCFKNQQLARKMASKL